MNKKTLVKQVSELLRENNIKKPISIPKHVFHISDDEGNTKDFAIKDTEKTAIYTVNDVTNIVDACLHVIGESLKRGEQISIYGFGTLGLTYRKPRSTKLIGTDEEIQIEGHYVPKFQFGNDLRMCAKLYELSLEEAAPEKEPIYDEYDNVSTEGDG